MASRALKEEGITDSTDWYSTPLPLLAGVDSALRCQVCRDYFDTPMITSCSHTFCSHCIRQCFSNNDGHCPTCRAKDQEVKLRPSWAMEELVLAFKKARPQVLEFARQPRESASQKRKREAGTTEDIVESGPVKRTRSGRATRAFPEVVEVEDSDGEFSSDDASSGDGLVKCPMCQGRMTMTAVQLHIDKCDGVLRTGKRTGSSQQPISGPPASVSKAIEPAERLSKPHYDMLKDAQLRKKLLDQGLSTSGTRQSMEQRYTEFCHLWNANCDSRNPKTKAGVRKELKDWEDIQTSRATLNAQKEGAQIKHKDFDAQAYATKNNESFNELIRAARESRQRARGKPNESEEAKKPEPIVSNSPPNTASTMRTSQAPDLASANVQPNNAHKNHQELQSSPLDTSPVNDHQEPGSFTEYANDSPPSSQIPRRPSSGRSSNL